MLVSILSRTIKETGDAALSVKNYISLSIWNLDGNKPQTVDEIWIR